MSQPVAPSDTQSPPAKPIVDVVLCAGQSNMRGYGKAEDLPGVLLAPHPTAQIFHEESLGPLLPGAGKYEGGFGPELSFGHTLAARSDRSIVLVKVAKGGTNLAEDWDPKATAGLQLYRKLLNATHNTSQRLLAQGVTPNFRGLFLYQGESDCEQADWAEAYADRLQTFIQRLRQDLSAPALPGVLVRVNPRWTDLMSNRFPVRQAIESVAHHDEHLAWIDIDDLYLPDDLHVDGPGLLTVGDRAAEAMSGLPMVDAPFSTDEDAVPQDEAQNVAQQRNVDNTTVLDNAASDPAVHESTAEPIAEIESASTTRNPETTNPPKPIDPTTDKPTKQQATPLPRPTETRVIALINQKGGVGKTTTTVNLGAALAQRGQRVLLVDLDPQAHLTLSIGIDPEDCDLTIYDLLSNDDVTALEVCREISPDLAILPADVSLAGIEAELAPKVVTGAAQQVLKTKCESLYQAFDYVLVDCPPALGLLTINGLTLAQEVIVPMQAHFLALQGLSKLLETVQMLGQGMNQRLKVSGVVLCMHEANTVLANEVVGEVQSFLDEARGSALPWADATVYSPPIRRNIKLAEAPGFGQSVFAYAPESNGATDYARLAESIAAQMVQ